MTTRTFRWLVIAAAAVALAWGGSRYFRREPLANVPPRPGPIVAFGDSLTQGVGARPEASYPAQLARLLGRPVINRGVAGETAAAALRRLERDVLAERPGVVLVLLGGNDLLQRNSADQAFAALEQIVERSIDSGAMVVLIGIEGLPLVSEDFGSRFKALARHHGCLYVPDILDGIFGRTALMADHIHPNAEGYALVAERVARALGPHLN